MWYLAAFIGGLVVAWVAWKWWQVGKSWRLATAGLELGASQRLALRMLRMAWRSATKLSDEKCLPIHRALAIYVETTEDEDWAERMKSAGWIKMALADFMSSVERSMDPSDPLMLELEQFGIVSRQGDIFGSNR